VKGSLWNACPCSLTYASSVDLQPWARGGVAFFLLFGRFLPRCQEVLMLFVQKITFLLLSLSQPPSNMMGPPAPPSLVSVAPVVAPTVPPSLRLIPQFCTTFPRRLYVNCVDRPPIVRFPSLSRTWMAARISPPRRILSLGSA